MMKILGHNVCFTSLYRPNFIKTDLIFSGKHGKEPEKRKENTYFTKSGRCYHLQLYHEFYFILQNQAKF
jgi:hypothetical protein